MDTRLSQQKDSTNPGEGEGEPWVLKVKGAENFHNIQRSPNCQLVPFKIVPYDSKKSEMLQSLTLST